MKALALFSGGLDSLLAIKLIQEAGVESRARLMGDKDIKVEDMKVKAIEVEAVYFLQPFLPDDQEYKLVNQIKTLIDQLNVKLHVVRLGECYLRMLESPKHGYGKAVNPCLDCHIFFLLTASGMMEEIGASFLVTGEVVGQRPKSQHQGAFPLIDRETGLEGLIVRPLSAGLLPPTIPEEKGWISLKHCPSIQGRQRKIQMELAKKHSLTYQAPAGGCLLTNVEYGRKVTDLLKHKKRLDMESMRFLAIGRHFRFSPGFKGIIGRDRVENEKLLRHFYKNRRDYEYSLLKAGRVPGPLAVGLGTPTTEDLHNLSLLVARYSDFTEGAKDFVRVVQGGPKHKLIKEEIVATKDHTFTERYRITKI